MRPRGAGKAAAKFSDWLNNQTHVKTFGIHDLQVEMEIGYMAAAGLLTRAKKNGLIEKIAQNKYKRVSISKDCRPYKREERIVSLNAVPDKAKELWAPPKQDPIERDLDLYSQYTTDDFIPTRPSPTPNPKASQGWQCPGCDAFINPTKDFCPRCSK